MEICITVTGKITKCMDWEDFIFSKITSFIRENFEMTKLVGEEFFSLVIPRTSIWEKWKMGSSMEKDYFIVKGLISGN